MIQPQWCRNRWAVWMMAVMALMHQAAVSPANAGDPCRLEVEKAVLEPFEKAGKFGYRLAGGMVIIEPRFVHALAFSAEGIAAVVDADGWAYIDRTGAVLVRPHVVDNGPDSFSEALARYTEDAKFGFIGERAQIVIPAGFAYAEPFRSNYALVCKDCRPVRDGEHTKMTGTQWGAIDKTGKIAVPLKHSRANALSAVKPLRRSD